MRVCLGASVSCWPWWHQAEDSWVHQDQVTLYEFLCCVWVCVCMRVCACFCELLALMASGRKFMGAPRPGEIV